MQQQANNAEGINKLRELVEKVRVGMLATIHEGNELYSRPMHTMQVDDNGCLWFFTNEKSEKVDDVKAEEKVYLMYSHPGEHTYLHLKGTSTIVNDQQKINELWSPIIKAWVPEGKNDPNLCLLKVKTEEASYWDSSSSSFVQFFNIVKAIATGERHDEGETGRLDLQS